MSATPNKKDYQVELIPLDMCQHPEWNPGHRHEDTSLAESIREDGLQSPILVRPCRRGKTKRSTILAYEVVAGNRRACGARAAGLEKIPAFVREMNDETAIKLCGVENLQRQNLSPLEEADWLKTYLELPSEDLESTALVFGLSERYVAERVRLAKNLSETWRDAAAGLGEEPSPAIQEWGFGLLAQVAKLEESSQLALLEEVSLWNEIPTQQQLRVEIARHTRHLSSSPWKWDDKTLVLGRPCTGCASRSDHQSQSLLWEEEDPIRKEARCLDQDCWARKQAAFDQRLAEKAKKDHGDEILACSPFQCREKKDFHGISYVDDSVWEYCQEEDPCARPVLQTSGAHRGKVVWMKQRRGTRGGSASQGPKSLASKREELKARRALCAAERIREALGHPDDFDAARAEPPTLIHPQVALALAAVFGTQEKRPHAAEWINRHTFPAAAWILEKGELQDLDDVNSWDVFDAVMDVLNRGGDELLQRFFQLQILPILVQRLRMNHTEAKYRLKLIEEGERVCELVGLDYGKIWEAVCAEKPEPKAWAAQEKKEKKVPKKKARKS